MGSGSRRRWKERTAPSLRVSGKLAGGDTTKEENAGSSKKPGKETCRLSRSLISVKHRAGKVKLAEYTLRVTGLLYFSFSRLEILRGSFIISI